MRATWTKIASGSYALKAASRDYIAGQTWLHQRMPEIKKPDVGAVFGSLERPPPVESLSQTDIESIRQCTSARRAIVEAAPVCFPCGNAPSRLDHNQTKAARERLNAS